MAYKPTSDRALFITTTLMTIFGLVMVFSASSVMASTKFHMAGYYFVRQLAFAGVGYLLMLFLMNLDYHVWQKEKLIRFMLIGTIAALLFVLTQPKVNGAHRWVRYGPLLSVQPSEIAKLVLLIFVAAYVERREAVVNSLRESLIPCLALVGLLAGLVAVEPDLGQAVTMVFIAALLLFAAGLSWVFVLSAVGLAVPAFYFFVVRVPFRWERVKAFLDPFQDPLGSGWQITQSLTAIGSGGWFGLGLGNSKQKLYFLPEAHSDFIFAVIGEELGLIGTFLVVLAFAFFFYRGVRIALKAPDRFGFYLALGITGMVAFQAFINISMVLALMPTKGIALPFISQGGTSLLLNLVSAGVLLNISHHAEKG